MPWMRCARSFSPLREEQQPYSAVDTPPARITCGGRGQVTGRFSTVIGQLASDKLEERLGAVYGLEHVLAESPQDHATVA